ncbi:hypothetical protein LTR08_001309 [Meristemomyces frigidus]|nr:hypothetical protein LTR08_001309 [Meristemomyces frigidus]
MGLPYLLKRLKEGDCTTTKELGRTTGQPHARAIIDGPGFAHYVLFTLGEKQGANRTIGTAVTYAECTTEAVKWLKDMEGYGYKIEAIFFDGALPESKRETRIERQENHAVKLTAYRDIHRASAWSYKPKKPAAREFIERSERVRKQARSDTAPPAFLVSAVLEALLDSEYADRTFVVPDEADRFCVAAARQACLDDVVLGVAIFANDSDLFVFDSGSATRVIPLNDLATRQEGNVSILTGIEVWPASLARNFVRPDLIEVAWHLASHPKTSITECVNLMHPGEPPNSLEWQEFFKSYQLDDQPQVLHKVRTDGAQRKLLNSLDARVSELVHQAKADNGMNTSAVFYMFLPSLLEDPDKASAWLVGGDLRGVAYEIVLMASACPNADIWEYKRRAAGIAPSMFRAWSSETLNPRFAQFSQLLQAGLELHKLGNDGETINCPTVEQWRYTAMQFALVAHIIQGWHLPSREEIVLVLTERQHTLWSVVHLSAFYQAAFYSLRILHQVMRYVKTVGGEFSQYVSGLEDRRSDFNVLLRQLGGMPNIADFFDVKEADGHERAAKWSPLAESLLRKVDKNWMPSRPTPKKRKSSGGDAVEKGGRGDGSPGSSNKFALLAYSNE